ncbi:MAG: NADH-quinone oxidoreductase subunit NuoH [Chloroflexaceae bacterium]|nr:NADH-quinone oxidoreductase subunit NuoH [Chloroflexaceae bacterium]
MDILQIVIMVAQALAVTLFITTGFAYLTWYERRLLARFQHRVGPNRAGPMGLLQPVADAVKLFFKEDIIPSAADRGVYLLAPVLAVMTAIVIWAVLPLGCFNLNGDHTACFDVARQGELNNILQIADVNIGILFLLAVTSVGVYGITLAGWASNSKYAMLGGIRSSAQLISYELAFGMAVLSVVMFGGTLSTWEIVHAQEGLWFYAPLVLGFVLFMIGATAELVRAPFDLVEAEQELTSGYNTEYGSMKFALFFMSEYMKMIAMSAIATTLFLGGWRFPGLEMLGNGVAELAGPWAAMVVVGIISLLSFLGKIALFLFVFVWLRASWPRMRYDQLMEFGWKSLLPLAIVNLTVIPVVLVLVPDNRWLQAIILFVFGIGSLLIASRVGNLPKPKMRKAQLVQTTRTEHQQQTGSIG